MKKLLVGLTILTSMLSFASDDESIEFECTAETKTKVLGGMKTTTGTIELGTYCPISGSDYCGTVEVKGTRYSAEFHLNKGTIGLTITDKTNMISDDVYVRSYTPLPTQVLDSSVYTQSSTKFMDITCREK